MYGIYRQCGSTISVINRVWCTEEVAEDICNKINFVRKRDYNFYFCKGLKGCKRGCKFSFEKKIIFEKSFNKFAVTRVKITMLRLFLASEVKGKFWNDVLKEKADELTFSVMSLKFLSKMMADAVHCR